MASTMDNIRAKFKRTFSHKDKEVDFENVDDADDETTGIVSKEIDSYDGDDKYPEGRPGGLLNRMISYGNKKTEEETERDRQAYLARQAQTGGATGASTGAGVSAAGSVPTAGAVPIADAGAAGAVPAHHHHDASSGAGGITGDGGAGASAGASAGGNAGSSGTSGGSGGV